MIVYLAAKAFYDDHDEIGVFSTEAKARAAIAAEQAADRHNHYWYGFRPLDIDTLASSSTQAQWQVVTS